MDEVEDFFDQNTYIIKDKKIKGRVMNVKNSNKTKGGRKRKMVIGQNVAQKMEEEEKM